MADLPITPAGRFVSPDGDFQRNLAVRIDGPVLADWSVLVYTESQVRDYVAQQVAEERERCAKLCDDAGGEIDPRDPDEALMMANSLAAEIRTEPNHG